MRFRNLSANPNPRVDCPQPSHPDCEVNLLAGGPLFSQQPSKLLLGVRQVPTDKTG